MAAPKLRPTSWRRFAWFVGLYVVSLGAFAAIVYGLRALVPR
jgi:hypothetical protein